MKIYNNFEFNEKLKINSIDKKEFDKIFYEKIKKDDLHQFDILKSNNHLYLLFIEDSIHLYTNIFKNVSSSNNGVLYCHDAYNADDCVGPHYIFLNTFDKHLHNIINADYDITDVFSIPEYKYSDIFSEFNIQKLSQANLNKWISRFNYNHIELK